MAATLVSLTGFQRGCENAELGINLESHEVDSRPEYKDFVTGYNGDVRGFAAGPVMSEITIAGEVTGANGVMSAAALAIGVAYVPANDVDQLSQSAGGCYVDSFTQSQSRDGFRRVSIKLTRHAGVT